MAENARYTSGENEWGTLAATRWGNIGRKLTYISRAPFSLERMSFNEGSKTVVYKGEHFHPTLARNFDVSDPLEWIARITSHIPKKGAKQVIYYGAYS